MATETVSHPLPHLDGLPPALVLNDTDYPYLLDLLDGALKAMPANSDAVHSGACLSAARAFLEVKEEDPDREAGDLNACTIRLAESAYVTLQDAQELGEMGDLAGRLLSHGEGALATWIDEVKAQPFTADNAGSWLNTLFDIQAYVQGAVSIYTEDTLRNAALQVPLACIASIIRILDRPGHPDGPPAHVPDDAGPAPATPAAAQSLEQVAHAQSNAMFDVRALLGTLMHSPELLEHDHLQRLVFMADEKIAELHTAFDPFI